MIIIGMVYQCLLFRMIITLADFNFKFGSGAEGDIVGKYPLYVGFVPKANIINCCVQSEVEPTCKALAEVPRDVRETQIGLAKTTRGKNG